MKPPSILLLFDHTALLAGKTRDWQEFTRLGECYLPQIVLEELRFLSGRAPDPTDELTAREFIRFYHTSSWRITQVHAIHPGLKPAPGQDVSKRARQALSVAYCAYGLSADHPGDLVVLVSNDQPLLMKIQSIRVRNLCGISYSSLLEWTRFNRQPVLVAQRLRAMETGSSFVVSTKPTRQATATRTGDIATKINSQKSHTKVNRMPRPSRERFDPRFDTDEDRKSISQIISFLIALAALSVAGFLIWGLFNPAYLNKFLGERGLPQLPSYQKDQ